VVSETDRDVLTWPDHVPLSDGVWLCVGLFDVVLEPVVVALNGADTVYVAEWRHEADRVRDAMSLDKVTVRVATSETLVVFVALRLPDEDLLNERLGVGVGGGVNVGVRVSINDPVMLSREDSLRDTLCDLDNDAGDDGVDDVLNEGVGVAVALTPPREGECVIDELIAGNETVCDSVAEPNKVNEAVRDAVTE